MAESDSTGNTAAPEHGSWPRAAFGGPAGKGLVPTVPWGSGREGGPGWVSPIPLLQPPRGSFLKHTLGRQDDVAQINALIYTRMAAGCRVTEGSLQPIRVAREWLQWGGG